MMKECFRSNVYKGLVSLSIIAVSFFGCASKPKVRTLKDFEKLEAAPLPVTKAQSADQVISLATESSDAIEIQKSKDDEMYVVSIPLGQKVPPVTCLVFPSAMDYMANALQRFIENLLKVEGIIGTQPALIDAGVMGAQPYLRVDTLYKHKANGQETLGKIKTLAFTSLGSGSALCGHDHVGYAQTFLRVFKQLTESLRLGATKGLPKPGHATVYIASLGSQKVGYVSSARYKKGDEMALFESSSLILPRTQTDLMPLDSGSIQNGSADGKLISASYFSKQGEKLDHKIDLKAKDKKTFNVSGSFKGKNIKGDIKPTMGPILTSYGLDRVKINSIFKDKKNAFSQEYYNPEADPLHLTLHQFKVTDLKNSEAQLKDRVGAVELSFDFNSNGETQKITSSLVGQTFTLQLVYSHGSL